MDGSPASSPRTGTARTALLVAAVAGAVHAGFSLYWALGGRWLVETLGERVVETFAGRELLLLPVGVAKLAGALIPYVLHRRDWPGPRWWRPLCWAGGAVLLAYGLVNTVSASLVLAGVVDVAAPDRPGLIGHALLWDPLFALWGAALLAGLWWSRRR